MKQTAAATLCVAEREEELGTGDILPHVDYSNLPGPVVVVLEKLKVNVLRLPEIMGG